MVMEVVVVMVASVVYWLAFMFTLHHDYYFSALLQRSSGIFPMPTEQIYWRTLNVQRFSLSVCVFFVVVAATVAVTSTLPSIFSSWILLCWVLQSPIHALSFCSTRKAMYFNIFIACNFIGFHSYYYDYVADSIYVCVVQLLHRMNVHFEFAIIVSLSLSRSPPPPPSLAHLYCSISL